MSSVRKNSPYSTNQGNEGNEGTCWAHSIKIKKKLNYFIIYIK
jgi:hypothetical protein